MNTSIQTAATQLEDETIIALANSCVLAMHSASAAATPRRFIHLIAHQVAAAGHDVNSTTVIAHLRTTLNALQATAAELTWATEAGRA